MALNDPDIDVNIKLKYLLEEDRQRLDSNLDSLVGEYQYFQSSALKELLSILAVTPDLNNHQKYQILEAFYEYSDDKEHAETLLKAYIPEDSVREFQVIIWLLTLGGEQYLPRLNKYLSNRALKDSLRYSHLLSLKERVDDRLILSGVKYFYQLKDISSRYKILSSQYILEKEPGVNDNWHNDIFNELFKMAENKEEEYNIRADAADTIHHYARDKTVQKHALCILKDLGGNARSIYENKQNVHNVNIDGSLTLLKSFEPVTNYADISELIIEKVKDMPIDVTKVSASLGRILLDVATYGPEDWTSGDILERVWSYIENYQADGSKELTVRLIEELESMAETCSSGHAIRLVNVLSGFGGDVKISFEDQIAGNFTGRLTAKLREIPDDEIRATVFAEMPYKGPEFSKWYIKFMPQVIEELRDEFVPAYVTLDQFDEYIRKAIGVFEGVEKRWGKNE